MKLLITNAAQVVTVDAHGERAKRGHEMRDIGVIENGAVLIDDEAIAWVGAASDVSSLNISGEAPEILDATGKVIVPGFVDAHTHLIFAGSREDEFALRCQGFTYQQIAERGGGILRTVAATRKASRKTLRSIAARRLDRMLRYGTTTAEIKSGYGLTEEDEVKMLQVARDLAMEHPMTIVNTFLGAHAIPPEFQSCREKYVDEIIARMLPYIARKELADFVDVFCDEGYFSPEETRKILQRASQLDFGIKLHADELASTGAVFLAMEFNAVSVDHLEHITQEEIDALAKSQTIAVLLPGVSFFLAHRYAPARSLIDAGAAVAIATDYNPGSCMAFSMPLMMTIACTQMKMTPEEVITASTLNAAAALGLSKSIGSIEAGKRADLVLLDIPDYRYLPYEFGGNHVWRVVKNGVLLEF